GEERRGRGEERRGERRRGAEEERRGEEGERRGEEGSDETKREEKRGEERRGGGVIKPKEKRKTPDRCAADSGRDGEMDGGRHKEMARTKEMTKYNEGEIVWKMRFRRKMDGGDHEICLSVLMA